MDVPLSRREIAEILRIDESTVEFLWASKQIARSLSSERRSSPEFYASSGFDVVEYQLFKAKDWFGVERDHVSAWVDILADALELSDLHPTDISALFRIVLANAINDGICQDNSRSRALAIACSAMYSRISAMTSE